MILLGSIIKKNDISIATCITVIYHVTSLTVLVQEYHVNPRSKIELRKAANKIFLQDGLINFYIYNMYNINIYMYRYMYPKTNANKQINIILYIVKLTL